MFLSTSIKVLPRPPYDPLLFPALKSMDSIDFTSVEGVRNQPETTAETIVAKFPHFTHKEYMVPGPPENASGTVKLGILTRTDSTSTSRPAFYLIHGGGQIAGNRFAGVEYVLSWFDDLDVVIVCVEYRLAPEHRAPAALNDSYAGLVWTADHAEELGVDSSRIMIMGCSGGGPIAAGSAMLARDNQHPSLCAQMLLTPMLDDRGSTVSSKQFETTGVWDGITNRMAWDCVLGPERGGPNVSPLISPSRATDLTGLPSTFIDAGEAEVFRDEAVTYASLLWKSGVATELHVWQGGFHGFDMLAPSIPVAQASVAIKISWIKRTFKLV